MNQDYDDMNDQRFAERLKALHPAGSSDEQFSAESILFRAGYEAGRDDVRLSLSTHATSRRWMPVVAASLLTALVTLPTAYRVGRQSRSTPALAVMERQSDPDSGTDVARETLQSASQGDEQETNRRDPAHERVSPISKVALPSFAQLWPAADRFRFSRIETLTAFHSRTPDSIPRSNWTALEDDVPVPSETISVGDLDKVTATLGFQVNQR